MNEQILLALHGGSAAVFLVTGLVFVRYWKNQRERLFGFFACAFWCFAAGFMVRIATGTHEHGAYVFLPRLLGFLLIIVAILDKNRRAR
jgi:hypothetical protein